MTVFLLLPGGWAQPEIRLKSGSAREGYPRAMPRQARSTHFVLRFAEEPGEETRRELERRGMRILQYVPDHALMVASSRTPNLEGLGAISMGSLEPAAKISPLLDGQVSGPLLVIFYPDADMSTARAEMAAADFAVLENPAMLTGHLVVSGPHANVPQLAVLDEVAYIMPASAELAAGVALVGCAGASTQSGPVGEYVLMGRGWARDQAGNVALHYFVNNFTDQIPAETVRSEIERALHEWTHYANFSLSAGSSAAGERSFDISFLRGVHGDGYPFDGPGGALAHTFYPNPPNPEPVAGDLHLDWNEPWRVGSNIDLYSVVLHEIGHALGLGHSDRPGAVMYPYYKLATSLTEDDIAAIRALYGSNSPEPPVPPAPTPTPTPPPTPPPTPTPTPAPPPAPKPAADRAPPSIQIKTPGTSVISTGAAIFALSGIASDNVGVTAVKWTNSNGGSGSAAGTTSWSAVGPLLVGTNVLTVRAYDAAGNSAWRSVTVVRR
ncbi:MAG: matrixin family metalloprotease [Candidatus Solibacter sp.]